MTSNHESIKAEYDKAKEQLNSLRQNRARAALRDDYAIARSYDAKIAEQLDTLARIERRLLKAVANDNML